MAELSGSGDAIIPLNEESLLTSLNENHLVPKESEFAHSSNQNQQGASVVIPNFNLNEGTFDRPNFGPVTNKHHVEANKIERATIIHHHHHNYPTKPQSSGDDQSETPNIAATRPKTKPSWRSSKGVDIPEGCVQISDDTYMFTKEPIKKGTQVYKGFQVHATGQKQWFAIKKIVPCDEKSKREVEHLVNLSRNSPHPNVIRIIRSKVHKELTHEVLYIVVELCKEKNLQDYLNENREKNKALDLKEAMSLAKQLIKAIKHIHRHGIIHGDLKPENILFSLEGGKIKVSDFGISKQLRDCRSVTKLTGLGTDGYRAPETYSSDVISKSADIYSLGIILFGLFTNGKHPHGDDPHLCIYNMKKNIGLDLSSLPMEMGSVRGELIDLLKKIFVLGPKKRPTIDDVFRRLFEGFSPSRTKEVPPPGADTEVSRPHVRQQEADVGRSGVSLYQRSPLPIVAQQILYDQTNRNNLMLDDTRREESRRSMVLRKLDDLSIDLDEVVWRVKSKEIFRDEAIGKGTPFDMKIPNIYSGCRIYRKSVFSSSFGPPLPHLKVKINGCEKTIHDLHEVELPRFVAVWPGIAVWFDRETLRLFAFNLCESLEVRFANKYEPERIFSVLPNKQSIPVYSVEQLIESVEHQSENDPFSRAVQFIFFAYSSWVAKIDIEVHLSHKMVKPKPRFENVVSNF